MLSLWFQISLCYSFKTFVLYALYFYTSIFIDLDYLFYSLYIAFVYCYVPFASKLLYTSFQFHAYCSFMICNFAFDLIDIMLGISVYASQPTYSIICIKSYIQTIFIISLSANQNSCIYYLKYILNLSCKVHLKTCRSSYMHLFASLTMFLTVIIPLFALCTILNI